MIIIKIGGSLFKKERSILFKINKTISNINKQHKTVVLTGGGEIADVIRKYQKKYKFSDSSAHWMAIRGMDINGRIITETRDDFKIVEDIQNCLRVSSRGFIPVFLVYKLLEKYDTLPEDWSVTSDSIAVFIAYILKANFVILLKDVDGLYKSLNNKKVLNIISSSQIKNYKNSCVDSFLPQIISQYNTNVYIVSGLYPARIKNVLAGKNELYTKIIP
jgi:5-(aminomethyl)-3-furanmethanol phosphate kinase